MPSLRRAHVAGSWYPDDAAQLASEVDAYVSRAHVDPLPAPPRAIIAPHAGLMYSGPVAAFAYAAVRDVAYDAIVLVGPSHFVAFQGVSIWPDGNWQTPFGAVAVDRELATALESASADIAVRPDAHGREHSIEMQLPFVARLLPGVPIVPLVMGHQTRGTAEALGDTLTRVLRDRAARAGGGPSRVLLVASSDLSHYEDAWTAAALDRIVTERVEQLDAGGLMTALEREPRHACGGGPMVSVLRASRQLGATQARLLHYADSGDVSGDKAAVVGYMAAVLW